MPPRAPYRVLAVDDVPSNLLTLRAILPLDEFSFCGVSGAEEAFSRLDAEAFDLVLLDVLLPGISGYDIARRLKADPRTASVPVVFLTALQDEGEVLEGFDAGGVDFVSKPFLPAELLARLRTHLALKDRNEALERVASELRQAKDSRDRFFSVLAHDLKNPFAGFLSLLEEVKTHHRTMEPRDVEESLQAMSTAAQNVYRLLENLLDWGRSQTGGLVLEPHPLDLASLLEEALDPLLPAFHRKTISLNVTAQGIVEVDHYTTVTVLRNLLSNAVKFTKPGGSVSVQTRSEPSAVVISIADTGVGIPPLRLDKLFLLDQKVSTPGTSREPGTGLGLILCADFAQRNGGTLRAESRVGEGTTFILELPVPKDCPDEGQEVSSLA